MKTHQNNVYNSLVAHRSFLRKPPVCSRLVYHALTAFVLVTAFQSAAQDSTESQEAKKRIVFEEQRIEGKLRRPQLVLIQAEQRPDFPPMVMQSLAGNANIVEFVDSAVIESSPYDGAFQFEHGKIVNYVP